MIPGIQDGMENCPDEDINLVYMTLSAFLGLVLFLAYQAYAKATKSLQKKKQETLKKNARIKKNKFRRL